MVWSVAIQFAVLVSEQVSDGADVIVIVVERLRHRQHTAVDLLKANMIAGCIVAPDPGHVVFTFVLGTYRINRFRKTFGNGIEFADYGNVWFVAIFPFTRVISEQKRLIKIYIENSRRMFQQIHELIYSTPPMFLTSYCCACDMCIHMR